MSNPSGHLLMQKVIEDASLPIAVRVQAMRESSYRPTLSFLLRLIRDPSTPPTLKAAAVIRYNQQLAIKELTREKRHERTKETEKPPENATPELV
jgi:hypothetical protein